VRGCVCCTSVCEYVCVCVWEEGEDGAKVDNVVVACLPCALRNCAGCGLTIGVGVGGGRSLWAGQREVFEKNKREKRQRAQSGIRGWVQSFFVVGLSAKRVKSVWLWLPLLKEIFS